MARNDGIDRTFARNQDLPTLDDVAKVQEHNEREKESYSNQDIDTTQTYRNIHFKAPTGSYAAMFDQMIADGVISTRGLKADAVKYGELIFDVNSASPSASRLPHNGKELICMARNDGIDRTFARNQDLPTLDDVAKVQEHNEREKDSYSNQDIDTTQTYRNIHFKAPTDSYAAMFDQMIADGVISTRGLKADAVKYGELIFDVNSAYFLNHGGYEYAMQFFTDAYKAAVVIVGGEQYIYPD